MFNSNKMIDKITLEEAEKLVETNDAEYFGMGWNNKFTLFYEKKVYVQDNHGTGPCYYNIKYLNKGSALTEDVQE